MDVQQKMVRADADNGLRWLGRNISGAAGLPFRPAQHLLHPWVPRTQSAG